MNELTAVIQAGGRGTRLAPYSTVLPKALMPVGDGAVIDHLLEQFSRAGVETVFVTVSRFGPLIRSYCGDGSRWNLQIEYVEEDAPLGTIGPLNALRGRLGSSFFVTNSDVFTDVNLKDMLEFHLSKLAPITVAVTNQEVQIAYGTLRYDDSGRMTSFHEKPVEQFAVSMGIYCMEPSVFDFIPEGKPFGFDELMATMLREGAPVNAFAHTGRWVDIGRIEDLRKAQVEAASGMPEDVHTHG